MFTELCMNKSNHNQFHNRTVTRVTRFYIGESGLYELFPLLEQIPTYNISKLIMMQTI